MPHVVKPKCFFYSHSSLGSRKRLPLALRASECQGELLLAAVGFQVPRRASACSPGLPSAMAGCRVPLQDDECRSGTPGHPGLPSAVAGCRVPW